MYFLILWLKLFYWKNLIVDLHVWKFFKYINMLSKLQTLGFCLSDIQLHEAIDVIIFQVLIHRNFDL